MELFLAMGFAATAMQGTPAAGCRVEGAKLLKPRLFADDICRRFRARLGPAGARLDIAIVLTARGIATVRLSGAGMAPTERTIAVSDRAIALDTLDQLAADAAATLRSNGAADTRPRMETDA